LSIVNIDAAFSYNINITVFVLCHTFNLFFIDFRNCCKKVLVESVVFIVDNVQKEFFIIWLLKVG